MTHIKRYRVKVVYGNLWFPNIHITHCQAANRS